MKSSTDSQAADMDDLRHWNRKMILELLEKYRSLPALWDVKCDEYKNKANKTKSYKELVDLCRRNGFPEANRDFVVKKIQSLRASFRKELKKTKQYKLEGKKYYSNLWYYKHLLFTKSQEADEEDDQSENSFEEKAFEETYVEDSYIEDDEEEYEIKPETTTTVSPEPSPRKTCKRGMDHTDYEPSHDSVKPRDLSETELTGLTIAKKLARMDSVQAIYAESIINNVIRRGLLKKLKEETGVCDFMCENRRNTINS